MAPVKVPKKPLKSMEKPVGGMSIRNPAKGVSGKKKARRNYESFSIYLFKLLKQSSEHDVGISKKSMLIMNNFVHDILEQVACEAGRLVAHSKKTTLAQDEIRTATKLLIPGELGKHAILEGEKALRNFKNSTSSQSY